MLCRHAFPTPRCGIDTNNIIESINSVWGKIRQLPPLQMIDAIYTYLMELVHNWSQEKQHSKHFADVPLAWFNDRLQRSQRYQVFGSGNGIYQVQIPDSGRKHIVNLIEHDCDCGDFYEYRSVCTHAIAACKYAVEDPFDHIDWKFSVKALRKTYSHFLVPISIENLSSKEGVQPPVVKK
jgi:hypothetical protein